MEEPVASRIVFSPLDHGDDTDDSLNLTSSEESVITSSIALSSSSSSSSLTNDDHNNLVPSDYNDEENNDPVLHIQKQKVTNDPLEAEYLPLTSPSFDNQTVYDAGHEEAMEMSSASSLSMNMDEPNGSNQAPSPRSRSSSSSSSSSFCVAAWFASSDDDRDEPADLTAVDSDSVAVDSAPIPSSCSPSFDFDHDADDELDTDDEADIERILIDELSLIPSEGGYHVASYPTNTSADDVAASRPTSASQVFHGIDDARESVSSLGGERSIGSLSPSSSSSDDFRPSDVSSLSHSDDLLSSLESSEWSDEGCDGFGSIENVPVIAMPTPWSHDQWHTHTILRPQVWRKDQYVLASNATCRRHQRIKSKSKTTPLVTADEGDADVKSTKAVTMIKPDLIEKDTYVDVAALEAILRRHCPILDGVFVDVGCGTSRLCRELVYRGYNHVIGVDYDQRTVAFQEDHAFELDQFVRFVVMDVTKHLDFPDQYCDHICTKSTIDEIAYNTAHNQLLQAAVCEIVRCLKIGGVWIIVAARNRCDDVWISDDEDRIANERAERPWWQWDAIASFMDRHLVLEKEYRAGPRRAAGGFADPPFVVRVLRRRETLMQRAHRRRVEYNDKVLSARAFSARLRYHHGRQQRRIEEHKQTEELRQMVVEDGASRIREAIDHCEGDQVNRARHRDKFYANLAAEEQRSMEDEDRLARLVHRMQQETLATARWIMRLIIDRALDGIASPGPSQPTKLDHEPPQVIKRAESANAGVTGLTAWIRAVVVTQLIEDALAQTSVNAVIAPVRRRNKRIVPPTTSRGEPITASSASDHLTIIVGVINGIIELAMAQHDQKRVASSEHTSVRSRIPGPDEHQSNNNDAEQLPAGVTSKLEESVDSDQRNVDGIVAPGAATSALVHTTISTMNSTPNDGQIALVGGNGTPVSDEATDLGTGTRDRSEKEIDSICVDVIQHLLQHVETAYLVVSSDGKAR